MILYPRTLLPRMCSASAAEIFSNRRNAVIAGRGNDPDRKGTTGVRHAARLGRTPLLRIAEPAFGNPPLNRPR
jgi:hypothetical protein